MTAGRGGGAGRPVREYAVACVAEYLRAQENLADTTIATDRPDDVAACEPLLLVEAIEELPPSRMPWARVRHVRIGMQGWAGPQIADTLLVMRRALAALLAARAVTMSSGQQITRVETRSDPVEAPDPRAGDKVHRMAAIVEVTIRARG